MITGKNNIAGNFVADGTNTFQSFNPKENKATAYTFTEATAAEIEAACKAANDAFFAYKKIDNKTKAIFLRTIASEIEALGDTLLQTYCEESGLPLARATMERGRTMGQLHAFANYIEQKNGFGVSIDEADTNRTPLPKPDVRKLNIPIGPIAVFGASNFPLAYSTAGGDTASAFAAGCSVVVKGHPMHAGTGELVAHAIVQAVEKTGMPKGIFSYLVSNSHTVGEVLVQNENIKGVGFTGSQAGGTALYKLAASRKTPIPVFAEMGSLNPVIFTIAALQNRFETLATTYANSISLGCGQFCTKPGLLIATKSESLDTFLNLLATKINEVAPQTMLHPNIKNNFEKNKQLVISENAAVLTNNNINNANDSSPIVTKVTANDFLQNPKLHTEVFGPFALVVICDDEVELNSVLQNLEGQLTATIIAEESDYENLLQIIDILQEKVGRIIFNGVPTGVEVCAAMTHGGPFPASTDSRFTAVGVHAIQRWLRPVSYQDFPKQLLPTSIQ